MESKKGFELLRSDPAGDVDDLIFCTEPDWVSSNR